MSKEVDQRIVEMQFNNADFEQKVSKSISRVLTILLKASAIWILATSQMVSTN